MECALLSPGDPRWQDSLDRCPHEFYHWPGYARLEAGRMGGEAAAFWVGSDSGAWLLPVVVCDCGGTGAVSKTAGSWRDAVTPYGYPDPLLWAEGGGEVAFLSSALAALQGFLQRTQVLTVFTRCSPLRPLSPVYAAFGQVVEHGPCYWIDLTLPRSELDAQLRPRYRSYLNALARSGVEACWIPVEHGLSRFVELYHRTMDRVGAARWYYFDHSYFAELARVLGDHLHLCEVHATGRTLASGLFASTDGVMQYLFSGIDESSGQPHATKLMMVFARDWAKEAGLHVLHLGGGIGARDDALSQFKRGFTHQSSIFRTWRWIVDQERYGALVRAWEEAAGVVADPIDGYFPAYRRQIPAGVCARAGREDADT